MPVAGERLKLAKAELWADGVPTKMLRGGMLPAARASEAGTREPLARLGGGNCVRKSILSYMHMHMCMCMYLI